MLNLKKSILSLLILISIAGYNISKIEISNTPATYIPPNLPSKILNDQLKSQFNNEDSIILVYESKNRLDQVLISKLSSFVMKLEAIENIKKVRSIFSYESIRSVDDGFEVTNIIDHNQINSLSFKDIESKVNSDRFVKDLFITSDLKTFGILIEPIYLNSSIDRLELDKKIKDLIDGLGLKKYETAYGGEFTVDTSQFIELNKIMFYILPLTFVVGVILLYLLFNSYIAVLLGTSLNGVVSFLVLSLFGMFNWPYNLIGAMIPTLMSALCIAFVVHLFNSILLRKNQGESHSDSIRNSVNAINRPSLFSALTTSAGLLSLSISEIPPIRSVGVIGGIGVMIIYFMVVHIMPAFLLRFDNCVWKQNALFQRVLDKTVITLVNISISHYKKVLVIISVSMCLLSLFLFNVISESNIYKFFSDNHNVNISNRVIKDKFVGTTIVNVVFDADSSIITSSAFNTKIDNLKKNILEISEVARVFSATDIIKQINWAFQGEDDVFFRVPDNDELLNQYLFIYDGADIYDFLSRDNKRFKLNINLNVEGANDIESVIDKIKNIIEQSDFTNSQVAFSGYGKMFSDQENLILSDLYKSVGISFIVIFLLMSFLWRSMSDSIFCMIPNISPVVSMFILMGIFGIWLDIGTAMIASVTVGIAVDDTIHIFEGIMKRIKKMSPSDAIKETYNESGRAIIITSLILSAQFIILTVVDFQPLRNFGLLTTLGVVTALVFDLLFLPAMILLKYKKTDF